MFIYDQIEDLKPSPEFFHAAAEELDLCLSIVTHGCQDYILKNDEIGLIVYSHDFTSSYCGV